jgi:hypothetical protein
MLTPFVSAIVASVFLLAAMFAWSGMRNEGMLSSFEPAAVQAEIVTESNTDVQIDFGVDPTEINLGETVAVSAAVALLNPGTYSMTWDLDITDGMTDATVISDTAGIVPGTYTYMAPGNFDATAYISHTDSPLDVLEATIPVTVTGPDVAVATDAVFGDAVEVSISNFNANAITGTNLVITSPTGMVYNTEVLAGDIAPDGTATADFVFDEVGTYTVTASLEAAPGFDLGGPVEDTVEIDIGEPGATLTADPTTITAGESVTFDAEVTDVITSAVTDYEIDFGDGSSESLPTGALSATTVYTYDMAGDYTALFTATLTGGAVYTDAASVMVESDVVTGGTLLLSADPTALTAGSDETSTVVATLTDSGDNPVAGEAVTITIESPVYGMRLTGDTTVVSGTTDASGAYTTTLTVGAVPGEVTLTASSPAADVDGTVDVTASPVGGGASATQAVTLSATDPNVATFDVGGRQIVVSLPAQPDLGGVTLYLNIAETVGATDAPSGTIVIYDFSLNVFLGQDLGPLEEGTQLATPPEGFNATGAQVTVGYTDEELAAAGLAQATPGVDEDTLALYDTVSPDGTGDLSDDPLPSERDTGANTVTGDVDQFGRHALAGEPAQTGTTLYLPLVAK